MKIINVKLSQCEYDIFINDNGFNFEALQSKLCNRKIAIISNDVVAPLYLESVKSALSEYNSEIFSHILPDGEQHKNHQSWQSILDFLADNNFNRSDLLISLGGGVICDMTGFAAASWMRGIDFIQIPTSLLAQVDASVGGKTGINHQLGKNLIGAFHQPKAVIINTATLMTLPNREFKSGLSEAIKYGFINQPDFIQWMNANSNGIKQLNLTLISELISQCCQFKAEIVQQDEKESGIRALLNLGHTFGHAIETITQYKQYSHGEAVAIGMVMAAELSVILELADKNLRKELENHLQEFNLHTKLSKDIKAESLIELMRLDKKVINHKHRLILMKSVGKAFIQNNVCEKELLKAITHCQ